jgi:hypothetical protein
MLTEDFIIAVYCLIDDFLKNIIRTYEKLWQRGPNPKLSDSEVITMELVGESFGMDKDKQIHRYFKDNWSDLFPNIPDRTVFVGQSANLWRIKQLIRKEVLHRLGFNQLSGIRIIDGFPMPICNFRRAHFCKLFSDEAKYGYCASKAQNYFGFKGHLLIDDRGTVIDINITAANVDEREALFTMTEQMSPLLLGDKGYLLNELRKSELNDHSIRLETPKRNNMKEHRHSSFLRWMNKTRRMIETVISQLTERFLIEKVRARDLWHLTNRVTRKILAHNLCQLIARTNGIQSLQFNKFVAL